VQVQSPAGTTASCVCWHEGCSDGAVHWKLITIHYNITFCLKERSAKRSAFVSVMHARLECKRTGTKLMPTTWGGERRVANHRSRLGQRQLSVAKQNGEKFKTTTTQCWNISRDRRSNQSKQSTSSGITVDVDNQCDLIAFYTQPLNEPSRWEREGGRDS